MHFVCNAHFFSNLVIFHIILRVYNITIILDIPTEIEKIWRLTSIPLRTAPLPL